MLQFLNEPDIVENEHCTSRRFIPQFLDMPSWRVVNDTLQEGPEERENLRARWV